VLAGALVGLVEGAGAFFRAEFGAGGFDEAVRVGCAGCQVDEVFSDG
jgi:hypothetical protein